MTMLTAWICLLLAPQPAPPTLLLVTGAGGSEEFATQFQAATESWRQHADEAGMEVLQVHGEKQEATPHDQLQELLKSLPEETLQPLWIVFIGHGTYAQRKAKFNMVGPDLTAGELGSWIERFRRPVAVINCSSASGPFINELSGAGRVIVTATRSGNEQNYSRFAVYMAESINDPAVDLDKDGQISLLEAFLAASNRVQRFYSEDNRLATEHALIDDNGDGLGTPASWFRGVYTFRRAKGAGSTDGLRANQLHLVKSLQEQALTPEVRKHRDTLEAELSKLREQRDTLAEEKYLAELERICLAIARLYRDADK